MFAQAEGVPDLVDRRVLQSLGNLRETAGREESRKVVLGIPSAFLRD
jgi:hypothetical protein